MKKIHIKYNIMIDDKDFDKICRKAMLGRDEMVREIKWWAQKSGKEWVDKFIDSTIQQ